MKTTAWTQAGTDAWNAFWEPRTAREKTLIGVGGAVLAVVLGWALLWEPASTGRAALKESVPALQRQLAQMNAQAAEAHTLAGAAASLAPDGVALKNALTASLASHGFGDAQAQLVGTAVHVQMKNVAFAAWVDWLEEVRAQYKVQVSEAHVEALKADGQVNLTASLQSTTAH